MSNAAFAGVAFLLSSFQVYRGSVVMAISGEQHSKVSTFFKFTLPMFLYFTKSIATNSIAGSATHAFRAVADPQPAANCFSQ